MKLYSLYYYIIFYLALLISSNIFSEDNLDLPPKIKQVKPIHLQNYKSFTLQNGLKVYIIENHKLPTVSFFMYLNYLPNLEPNKSGLGEITAKLIKQGARKKTKYEIDEELDFMGTDLNIDNNVVFANSLSKYSEKTLEIISDILLSPNFDENEFLKIKEEMILKIQSEKNNPESIIANVSKKLLYGNSHLYGEVPTENTINKITLNDCIKYHQTYFRPNITHLAIMGDINLEEGKRLTEKYLNSWKQKKIPSKHKRHLIKNRKTEIYLMNRNESVQSVIRITHNINFPQNDKNIHSAMVMNTILGGGMFRLYQNLREKKGYTYGVYSSLHPDKLVGNFSVDFSTENSSTHKSIKEVFWELNRIRRLEVEKKELQLAKNYLIGQFSLSLENPETIALFAIRSAIYHLPPDYFQTYIEKINQVSIKDVKKAAQKYIDPSNSNIIIVGRKKDLLRKLKSLKKYKVLEINDQGKIKKG